jgi:hypothetical protein
LGIIVTTQGAGAVPLLNTLKTVPVVSNSIG